MKTRYFLIGGLSLIVASSLFGAEPKTINFQGYLTDSSDTPINESKNITFKIYNVSTDGTPLWTSTKNLTVSNGVYSTVLGDTVEFNLTKMKFNEQYYLGIEVESDGEMSPRVTMTNVAYANVFKEINSSDLNASYLDETSDSDSMPVTFAQVKEFLRNWYKNGEVVDSPPDLQTITFNGLEYKEIYDPNTGRIWLDRNLGASQACTVNNDTTSACFGDLYQWGREADGHQSRTSSTTGTKATSLSPGHGSFIIDSDTTLPEPEWVTQSLVSSLTDWDSSRDPCPTGYHVPTKIEFETFKGGGAAFSFLKMPLAGYRSGATGSISLQYHSMWLNSKITYTDGYAYHYFDESGSIGTTSQGHGISVRCIKDQ